LKLWFFDYLIGGRSEKNENGPDNGKDDKKDEDTNEKRYNNFK
jgi:hypothetical protein